MLTVDVEHDWGTSGTRGLDEALPWLLDLLARHAVPATFFVVGSLAPHAARHLSPDGPHEVGSHGLTHCRLAGLPTTRLDEELRGSRRRLHDAGFEVDGFRAPFFAAPEGLLPRLAASGYAYDASLGSLWPSRANRFGVVPVGGPRAPLPRLGSASLRDGWLPANLTWMRLLHPLGRRLLGGCAHQVSCHLHEFVDGPGGWRDWPTPLRLLHARGCGRRARALLEEILARPGRRWLTGRAFLRAHAEEAGSDRHGAGC